MATKGKYLVKAAVPVLLFFLLKTVVTGCGGGPQTDGMAVSETVGAFIKADVLIKQAVGEADYATAVALVLKSAEIDAELNCGGGMAPVSGVFNPTDSENADFDLKADPQECFGILEGTIGFAGHLTGSISNGELDYSFKSAPDVSNIVTMAEGAEPFSRSCAVNLSGLDVAHDYVWLDGGSPEESCEVSGTITAHCTIYEKTADVECLWAGTGCDQLSQWSLYDLCTCAGSGC